MKPPPTDATHENTSNFTIYRWYKLTRDGDWKVWSGEAWRVSYMHASFFKQLEELK